MQSTKKLLSLQWNILGQWNRVSEKLGFITFFFIKCSSINKVLC